MNNNDNEDEYNVYDVYDAERCWIVVKYYCKYIEYERHQQIM